MATLRHWPRPAQASPPPSASCQTTYREYIDLLQKRRDVCAKAAQATECSQVERMVTKADGGTPFPDCIFTRTENADDSLPCEPANGPGLLQARLQELGASSNSAPPAVRTRLAQVMESVQTCATHRGHHRGHRRR